MIESIVAIFYLVIVIWLCLHTVWKAFGIQTITTRGKVWRIIVVIGLFVIVVLSLTGLVEAALMIVDLTQ